MNTTKDGIGPEQRDIVQISFPFTDLTKIKKRPVIILSNNRYNSKNEDVICCAITSNPREYFNSVELAEGDFEKGGLPYQSRIKTNKIGTIHQNKIIKKYGVLKSEKSEKVLEALIANLQILQIKD